MITFFVAFSATYFLLEAGGCGKEWVDGKQGITGFVIHLILGAFGIYALIVGK